VDWTAPGSVDNSRLLFELRRKSYERSTLHIQIHLASKEIKDEWDELEQKMEDFSGNARQFSEDVKLKETGAQV